MNEEVHFYFIRHGETYFNQYERIQGWSDTPLTDRGREVVRNSGRGLAHIQFDAVYTSDLRRTTETATLLLAENTVTSVDVPYQEMRELRELFSGFFEGMDGQTVWSMIADKLGYASTETFLQLTDDRQRMDDAHKVDPAGHAENYEMFWERTKKGLERILDTHKEPGENVLVVSHGLTIRYIMEYLIPDLVDADSVENGSVTVVKRVAGRYELDRHNDVSHFISEVTEKK